MHSCLPVFTAIVPIPNSRLAGIGLGHVTSMGSEVWVEGTRAPSEQRLTSHRGTSLWPPPHLRNVPFHGAVLQYMNLMSRATEVLPERSPAKLTDTLWTFPLFFSIKKLCFLTSMSSAVLWVFLLVYILRECVLHRYFRFNNYEKGPFYMFLIWSSEQHCYRYYR